MKRLNRLSVSALILLATMLVGAMLASCSLDKDEPNESQPARKGEMVTVGATVSFRGDFSALSRAIAQETASDSTRNRMNRAMDADGHKHFVNGDQVMLVYQTTDGETLTAISDKYRKPANSGGQDSSFYFTWEVEDPDDTKDFTLVYPAYRCNSTTGAIDYEALSQQDGSLATASKLDLATFTGGWKYMYEPDAIPLRNPLTVCKFTITNCNDRDITVLVTDLRISEDSHSYVISRRAGDSPIYVIMQAVEKKSFLFMTTINGKHLVKYVKNKTLKAGNMYPITVSVDTVDLHNGPLPGVFTSFARQRDNHVPVGRRATERYFQFSPGNLQAYTGDHGQSWSLAFAPNQWDYIGTNGLNLLLDDNHWHGWNKGKVDLFSYSTSNPKSNYGIYAEEANTSRTMGSFRDWGDYFNGNKLRSDPNYVGWNTLGGDEWDFLLCYDKAYPSKASTINGVANARYAKGKVNRVKGLILFPDLYIQPAGIKLPEAINEDKSDLGWSKNDYKDDDWTRMEVAGAVFLPAAGTRFDTSSYWEDEGSYWTCTQHPNGDNEKGSSAENLHFNAKHVYPDVGEIRSFGLSVRLVHYISKREYRDSK